ncbi:MAG: hypothetical protein WC291_08165 [Thermodesulfovibrionales bacterium]|jgi:hypothetical protein
MKERTDALEIDRIAFFGRTFSEYTAMFGLDEELLRKGPMLDCPGGASSFAAEAHLKGLDVTASDILYFLSADELLAKGRRDIAHVFEKFDAASHLYTWTHYKDKAEVMAQRTKALEGFIRDFERGKKEGRYVRAELPRLPFPDRQFSLVLSANFLFLYGDRMGFDFHIACIRELLRVSSGEVRIFPFVGLDALPYPHLHEVITALRGEGVSSEILPVDFEFQRGANQVLRLKAKSNIPPSADHALQTCHTWQ